MLEANIQVSFQSFQLNIDLKVGDFKILALYGPNGSGKSTLLKSIAGFSPQNSKCHIKVDGMTWQDESRSLPQNQRDSALQFQDLRLFQNMTAKNNIEFSKRYAKHTVSPHLEETLFDKLAVNELLDKMPAALSGGESQRVCLARTLCRNAKNILLDEPFSALDRRNKEVILPWIREFIQEKDKRLIFVSHDINDIKKIADTVIILEKGEISFQGTSVESEKYF